jgi:hypothetical protein
MSETIPTRQYFEAAIAQLEQLAGAETDADRLREIYSQIARLRYAMIDQSFDAIVRRTPLLQSLVAELQAAIAGAQGKPSLSGAVTSLTGVLNEVRTAMDLVSSAASALTQPLGGATRSRSMAGGRAKAAARSLNAGADMTILCIHGVGDHHTNTAWQTGWKDAILDGLRRWNAAATADIQFLMYDQLFDKAALNAGTVASAVWKLGISGVWHGIGDLFRRPRGLTDLPNELRWTAGMVAQWAENDGLRAKTRLEVEKAIAEHKPDVIMAHSLGSLISYDAFRHNENLLNGKTYITFGSQIGNPFVRSTFAGRIEPLEPARLWYHLFNENDRAFAHQLRLTDPNFVEVTAEFNEGLIHHDALRYLTHSNVSSTVWYDLATRGRARALPQPKAIRDTRKIFNVVAQKPKMRALLIGINEYPDPESRLEGCVNDVFRVSAALQESGFSSEDIRTVFDDRATAAGILERLHWLLDGVCPGDVRFLYYSGHGAQVPDYGAFNKIDHVNECLVPYDFDWSPERAIMDTQFHDFYSQLPYDSRFVAIFDCCHSGGMTKSGGHKVRGLNPPDDVRHRMLRWDQKNQMWAQRDLKNPELTQTNATEAFTGKSKVELRLGRANFLRLPEKKQDKREVEYDHDGPFMPVLLQACQANQLSYEYRDGVTSYGAFTFALTTALRTARTKEKKITWNQLVKRTAKVLKHHKYDQSPCLAGPRAIRSKPVPWLPGAANFGKQRGWGNR